MRQMGWLIPDRWSPNTANNTYPQAQPYPAYPLPPPASPSQNIHPTNKTQFVPCYFRHSACPYNTASIYPIAYLPNYPQYTAHLLSNHPVSG